MLLDKWYLDAVFPDGTVWYGYRAWLRLWKCPPLSWASGCEVLPDGRERRISSWNKLAEPRLEGGRWHWKGPDGFAARWAPSCQGVESALGSDERFRVRWNCLAPRAMVLRNNGKGAGSGAGENGLLKGAGYVEHLRVESAGTGLPFRELSWGRAHAGDASLVWIRWGRGRDLCFLFEDGFQVTGELETPSTDGARVRTARGCWETGPGRPICERDVRRSFPRWLVWLAGGLAPARERKMAGPVRLRTSSGDFTGTAVWEEVTWA